MIDKSKFYIWTEKFRPSTLEDCVLPKTTKKQIEEFMEQGQIPHMLFSGSAGTGKTTLAKVIAHKLNADLLYINASNENGIDTVRMKIVQFASTSSFENNLKIILLDEADHLSTASQAALRATLEEFHESTRFILTCNFKNKIIEPLHSRCAHIDFTIPVAEKQEIAGKIFKRVSSILVTENVEADKKVVAALVMKYFPDFRKILNELQRFSTGGTIDASILVDANTTTDELFEAMKAKKFMEVRKWFARNADLDHQGLFRTFYDRAPELFLGPSLPSIILCLAQYQHWSSSVVDQELNSVAMAVEIMASAEWK